MKIVHIVCIFKDFPYLCKLLAASYLIEQITIKNKLYYV